jgi:hypothetical protein
MKELLNEEEFDPKKLFDKNEYNTLIIGREGFTKADNAIADVLESLFDKETTREMREALFSQLKEMNAVDMLVNTIKETKDPEQQAILTEACWESGLDFKDHYLFFVTLACSDHFHLAHEAITVLEYNETRPADDVIQNALQILNNAKSSQTVLLEELRSLLTGKKT